MFKDKESIFKKLAHLVNSDRNEDDFEDVEEEQVDDRGDWMEEENSEGQLTIDMHQTPKGIIIQTIVAGVRPEDLDISINREMVVIKGKRESSKTISREDYFHQEL